MQVIGDAQMAAYKLEHRVVGQVRVGLFAGEQHLYSGNQQEGTEHIEDPGELLDQGAAYADHDRAQHHHAEDAPEQHPVLVEAGDGEVAEDHRHDEDIVHGQRLLDQEPGVELQGTLCAQLPPDPPAKQHTDTEIAGVQQQAFAHLDFVSLAMQHAQVQYQQGQDNANECQPEPGAGAENVIVEKCL
ncbi:hypothetical protein D3C77_513180 [compost metagenome]